MVCFVVVWSTHVAVASAHRHSLRIPTNLGSGSRLMHQLHISRGNGLTHRDQNFKRSNLQNSNSDFHQISEEFETQHDARELCAD